MMFMNYWNIYGRMLGSLLSCRPWRISGNTLEKWNNRGRYTMIPRSYGYRSRFLVMIAKFHPRRKWLLFLFRALCGDQQPPETLVSWFGLFVNHWALVLQLHFLEFEIKINHAHTAWTAWHTSNPIILMGSQSCTHVSLWVDAPNAQVPIPGHASLYPILKRLVWGLNIAYTLPTTHAVGFCCTEIGGDWKWMKQLWRFDASWLSHELCHLCDARKMTYDNFAVSNWHSSAQFVLKLPDPVCPLALLRGFDVTMIRWCQLHNVNLGLCWTANGSSLLYLIQLGYFGDPQTQLLSLLDIAYLDFKEFTRAGGWRHSQRKFTPKLIIKTGSGAYMTTKGWNARVITAWLANCSLMAFNGTTECFGDQYGIFFYMSESCVDASNYTFEIWGWVFIFYKCTAL